MIIPVVKNGVLSIVDYGVFAPTMPWGDLIVIPSEVVKTHDSGTTPAYMVLQLGNGEEYATTGFYAIQDWKYIDSFRITDPALARLLLPRLLPPGVPLSWVETFGIFHDDEESGKWWLFAELNPDIVWETGYLGEDYPILEIPCLYWDIAPRLPNNLIYREG